MEVQCKLCKQSSKTPLHSYLTNVPKEKHVKASVEKILELSDKHPVPFPIDTARFKTLLKDYPFKEQLKKKHNCEFTKQLVQRYIDSTYPIIHEKLVPLLISFIEEKRASFQNVERKYYRQLTPYGLITKLLYNRPMTFVGPNDKYLLEDETFGAGTDFDKIGKDSTKRSDFSLDKLNSYDEMKIAALVSVSGWSHFINSGSRDNNGEYGDGINHELEGVIMAQVGPRFHRRYQMDYQDFVLSEQQNTEENGYGKKGFGKRFNLNKMWARLWGVDHLPTFKDKSIRKYDPIPGVSSLLDRDLYKERIKMMAEVLLLDANHRAVAVHKKAYVHVVGLGLGVWRICPTQAELFVDAFGDSIQLLNSNSLLGNIGYIDFSWIDCPQIKGVTNGQKFHKTDILIRFSKRDLHAPVPEGCLLVCNFAWDSNTPPGNEYWSGSLYTSSDPAAACSSGVAELQNARINPRMSGACTRVACVSEGIIPLSQYIEHVKEQFGLLDEENKELPEEEEKSEDEEPRKSVGSWLAKKFRPNRIFKS